MELLSHTGPRNLQGAPFRYEAGLLAGAFSDFISASSRLEAAYEKLQAEVTYLSHELAERNSALKASLAENEQVHRALQQIVDSMPCGVLVVEEDGSVSVINPEGRHLLDIGEESAEHLDAISLASGVDLAGFLRRDNDFENEQEFCKVSRSGKRWVSVQNRRLLRGDDSDLSGWQQTILILRDVTLHKQAEQERERARKATALAEVATTLAHEIRNPLASLELFAGLLAQGGDGADEWVSHLHAGIRSLSATVNNVLSFHGVGFPSLAPLDLVASIRSSVEFARPIADEAGILLSFGADGMPLRVQGNSSALQQVVLNIVCNAIRHTASGGSVRVTVYELEPANDETPGRAAIEFADTGCGISPDDIRQIFQAGFSGSGSTSGLGLAVCSQILRQHDADIRVASKLGVGTIFRVEIPTL